MNAVFGIALVLVLVGLLMAAVGLVIWPLSSGSSTSIIADRIRAAAFGNEERWRNVGVEYEHGSVNLTGHVKTGEEKWEARNLIWLKALPALKGVKIDAVFNSIQSDTSDPMPASPNTLEDSAWAWQRLKKP